MSTRLWIGALGTLAVCALQAPQAQGQSKPPRDLIRGHEVRLELRGDASFTGELLGVTADSMSVLGQDQSLRTLAFDQIGEMDMARHSFGWSKVWTWSAVGALASGLGLFAACSSVEDASGCGGVFVTTALSWGVIGGLFGAVINAQRWRSTAPDPEVVRPYSRYPQGMPDGWRGR